MSVDILTSDDNYVPSELWRRKEIHMETDAEMLAVGVPKAVTLYKSKVVEALIKELQAKLDDESFPTTSRWRYHAAVGGLQSG